MSRPTHTPVFARTARLGDLWTATRTDHSGEARAAVAFVLTPIVRAALQRNPSLTTTPSTLADVGYRALLDAIDGYDPKHDGTLEDHAWRTVNAAVCAASSTIGTPQDAVVLQ